MNLNKLKQLLKNDEGFKLDFKLKLSLELESEKKEFVKDVIAIANTPGGRGYILFGIEDKTRMIVGIEDIPNNIEERIQQIISNRSVPPVPVKFEAKMINHKMIGILTIFKSMQVPHQMLQTGAFYVRRGSTTDKATRHEIANMLQQFGMLSFENVPCRSATLEELDFDLIDKHIGYMGSYKKQDKLVLSTLGIIAADFERGVYYPTYGGLLLFGKNPQNFIPQAVLEIQYASRIVAVTGNISKILEGFEEIIKQIVPISYPKAALIEVVSNAVIHRNYWNSAQFTSVSIKEDYIKVSNPMSYEYREVKEDRIRINPWLYSRLLIIQQKEKDFHFGIGLDKVKELFGTKEAVRIQTNLVEGLFEVCLPGTRTYET
ncbi:AlbA family DNA-binding domain-containing protein [Cellulosilyticum sp. I15G10I2]|uniref:AlbA family DNA-binding domain-containing protein n=1 Tax=Cellulosilyticum sp. I15G10I2 TaxID=1892843 RepID=UPI00085BB598|nr:RNA-binding domain-containing protein [Cellulosilyticum sp. I15G10I2]